MMRLAPAFAIALLVLTSACSQSASDGQADAAHADTTHAAGGAAAAGHTAAGHAASSGGQALLPIMQKLGSEMSALTYALMKSDYPTVEQRAAAIAEHAPISAEELERIRTVLGPEMAKFEAVDESVHVASVHLHDAARSRQPGQVVERLGEVQRGCVSCHTQFRQRLVANRNGEWSPAVRRRTSKSSMRGTGS